MKHLEYAKRFLIIMQSTQLKAVEIAKRMQNFYNGKMINSRSVSGIFIVLIIALQIGCSGNDPQDANLAANSSSPNASAVAPKDNVEDLANIIKLNVEPEEATYAETNLNDQHGEQNLPGPNEKKLVAVLKFSPEKAAQIIAQAEKYQPPAASETSAESWYPAELTAQSQLTGDGTIKGITYSAQDFMQAPYRNGKLTKIDNTNYFILELITF